MKNSTYTLAKKQCKLSEISPRRSDDFPKALKLQNKSRNLIKVICKTEIFTGFLHLSELEYPPDFPEEVQRHVPTPQDHYNMYNCW